MRRWMAATLGAASLGMGALVHLPTRERLFKPQVVLNEYTWFPALLGGTAVGLSAARRPRSRVGMALGLYGLGLSARPVLKVRRTVAALEAAMQAGLGGDYRERIPAPVRDRLAGRTRGPAPRLLEDVAYTVTPARALKLDVYQPAEPPLVGDRYPAILVIHGGSWKQGNKGGLWAAHSRALARQGFVVFDIQYRLSHEAGWPAPLDDVRAAIGWVKAHADVYQLDPDRLALYGRSAGGQLALSAAYRCDEPGADTSVRAVVALYPPTDLRLWPPVPDTPLTALLGGTYLECPDAYADASPVEFCRPGVPPTLIAQGDMDNLVTPEHALRLIARLRAAGAPAVLLRIPWGRHGFDAMMNGLGARLTRPPMDRFLAWSLYGDAPR